jgi:hypothetical protein
MNDNKWFAHKNFTSLEIRAYTPSTYHTAQKSVTIHDSAIIKNLVERIEKISPDGDMMVSWSDTIEITELIFKSENGDQSIEIYGELFKTPSTGFNYGDTTEEEALCQEIIRYLK